MIKKKATKRTLFMSFVSMFLCFAMLLGTTYAWFTDSVTSATNVITAGNLDVELYHANKGTNGESKIVNESTVLFTDVDSNKWEPGAMAWEKFTVKNTGDLALKFEFALNVMGATVIDGISFAKMLKVAVVDENFDYSDRENVKNITEWKDLDSFTTIASAPEGLTANQEKTFGVIIWWKPSTEDNLFNMNNGKQAGSVGVNVGVVLSATQFTNEVDSFGADYDTDATFPPEAIHFAETVELTNELIANNELTQSIIVGNSRYTHAIIPEGTEVDGTTLALKIDSMTESEANVNLVSGAVAKSFDVRIEGMANSEKSAIITVYGMISDGIDEQNVALYHVENGITNTMTRVDALTEVDEHNEFFYDASTGAVTMALASFSEIMAVVNPVIEETTTSIVTSVTLNNDGTLTETVSKTNDEGNISLVLPENLKFDEGTTDAVLNVEAMDTSSANITLAEGEKSISYDIHVEGVASDNTIPVEITLYEFLSTGLNAGNFSLYHVEGDETISMTVLANGEEPEHNTFRYDPATGNVTLYLASFSEVAVVVSEAAWKGDYDFTWYEAGEIEIKDDKGNVIEKYYRISNADQLAAFGALVGGMVKVDANGKYSHVNVADGSTERITVDFKGKTVHLISNINLNDSEEDGKIFHPIGYYYTENKDGVAGKAYSTVSSFEGTFDGNGFTISNFYQNTWEIKGDYNDGYPAGSNYYKDAMGLFGYVVNGTVKNLTVDNFSSDGEFTPTGVIAAYAVNSTFENIAITNCNPRVYNTGNGGIVGIGGNSDDPDSYKLTFTNITIDNTNKITALWGSWDVACGGLIGMFRGAGHVKMTNCHVGAQIDVYNDVCGNYQYYWYRYAGILIGTNKNMYTDDNGYTVPETEKFEATGCTVHFGDWNDYYYCELVANSLASYTHDHQFSRLTEIASLDEIKSGDTWTKTGNFLLIDGDIKTCYHIVKDAEGNLKQHLHTDSGEEVIDGETVLKEDKQIVYLPFNQLFTGYGWGVKHVPIYDNEAENVFAGVKILGRTEANSVVKFEGRLFNREVSADGNVIKEGILSSPVSDRHYKLSHLFNYLEDSNVRVVGGAITISVTNLSENGNVTATLVRDPNNWENSELTFSGGGRIRLTIQDYYYCTPTTIEVEVRNYPEGSKIRNFTYDGFANDHDYHFNAQADHITNGKHGVYECNFGFGPEVLDYAHKLDSKGKIKFTAPADGVFTIAFASQNVGSGIKYTVDGANSTDLDRVDDPFELHIARLNMQAGKTYEFTRISSECGIYYIGYIPKTSIPNDHTHTYYDDNTATCTTGGKLVEMCLVCGKTTTTDSQPLGHTYEKLDLCMFEGCRQSYSAHNNSALGHAYINEPGYHETCTDNGKKPGVYCTRCDKVLEGCDTIPAHGHKYVNGFCRCGSHQCHQPEKINNVYKEVLFSTGDANDYKDYGTNSFFVPHGSCDMSNDSKYLIMKTSITDKNEAISPYIEFTVTQNVSFYAKVSSTGRGNYSNFVLRKLDGEKETDINSIFHTDEAIIHVEGVSGHTIVYNLNPGTYRFYCTSTDRVGRVMAMTVSRDVVKNYEVPAQ